jgi:light-regulated signal transduction histidine kinase (bacteriophytochrome)
LILMDVQMPNMDGFETAGLIYEREKLKHIPIIFITANNYGEEHVFQGYRSGAVDYIYKPVNPDLLRIKVGVFIELYKKTHQLMAHEQKLISINKSLENEVYERKMSEEKVNQLNHQLLESIDRLEMANKELDRFAFMSSHDLQEPLRKIKFYSDYINDKYAALLDADARKYLDRIQSAAERMQALIKDILDFSNLSGNTDNTVKTDLGILVREVVQELQENIVARNARITIDELPVLDVVPGLFHALFANLVSNALKYAKADIVPEINIRAELDVASVGNKTGSKIYNRIFVQDNGIGFDQKYAEQVFEMFKRLHNNGTYKGTGIGLALCKRIVEKHHGYITALSQPRVGTTFIISLPLNATDINLKNYDYQLLDKPLKNK